MTNDANPTRRQVIASALGLAGAAAVARLAGPAIFGSDQRLSAQDAAAAAPPIQGPAEAHAPAVRLGPAPSAIIVPPEGKTAFPMAPSDACYVLDNFGDCRGSRLHEGVDILDVRNQEIFAVVPGTLHDIFDDPTSTAGYGWTLLGDDGLIYRYFHLDHFAAGLVVGSRVAFGDVIGYVGSSGNFNADGTENRANTHLHFEIRLDTGASLWQSQPVNPLDRIAVPPFVPVSSPLRCY
jgi:murein DD-endopeptidase MepM/ murein hydrolase activator NlpD